MAFSGYLKNPPKWLYIGIFSLIAVAIIIIGYVFVQNRAAQIKKEKHKELSVIAQLKVDQIVRWRTERLNDGYLAARDPFIVSSINSLLNTREPGKNNVLAERFISYKYIKEYTGITILDSALNPVFGDKPFINEDKTYLRNILNNNQPVLSDIDFDTTNKTAYLELYIPLYIGGKKTALIAAKIDPENNLYPILSSWPTPSETSEILIFTEKNGSIKYLNRLRHLKKSEFPFSLPATNSELPAVMAARGKRGIVEGTDYRGAEVLADLKEIPGSNWLVVTKIDKREVFSSVYNLYSMVIFIVNLLVFSAAVTIGLLWRNKSAKFYKQLYNMENRQKELLQQYEFITQNANVIILLVDLNGNIIYANESASRLYGYTVDELKQMKLSDIRVEELSPGLPSYDEIKDKEGHEYEAIHRTKSGDLVYIDVGARLLSYGGKDVIICIFRNITEKKHAEDMLRKTLAEKEMLLKEVHHRVKNNLQTISSLLGLQSAMIDDERIRRIFSDSQIRIKSMSLLHQSLYNENAEFVNSEKYFHNLLQNLMSAYNSEGSNISLDASIDEIKVSVEHATTLGLVITEIISNIFKHAFPDSRAGKIYFKFREIPGSGFILTISDDGVGLPADFNIDLNSGLGMRLIQLLPKQIGATINIHNSSGTTYVLECPNK
jgi:PAS domain S-box-containing protein